MARNDGNVSTPTSASKNSSVHIHCALRRRQRAKKNSDGSNQRQAEKPIGEEPDHKVWDQKLVLFPLQVHGQEVHEGPPDRHEGSKHPEIRKSIVSQLLFESPRSQRPNGLVKLLLRSEPARHALAHNFSVADLDSLTTCWVDVVYAATPALRLSQTEVLHLTLDGLQRPIIFAESMNKEQTFGGNEGNNHCPYQETIFERAENGKEARSEGTNASCAYDKAQQYRFDLQDVGFLRGFWMGFEKCSNFKQAPQPILGACQGGKTENSCYELQAKGIPTIDQASA